MHDQTGQFPFKLLELAGAVVLIKDLDAVAQLSPLHLQDASQGTCEGATAPTASRNSGLRQCELLGDTSVQRCQRAG